MTAKLCAWIGVIGLVPALAVLIGGLLHSGFGYSALGDAIADPSATRHPLLYGVIGYPPVVVVGAFTALILNLIPTVRMLRGKYVKGYRTPRRSTWLNPAVGLLSAVTIVLIASYLAVENLSGP